MNVGNVRFAEKSSNLTKAAVVLYRRMVGPRHTACDECLIAAVFAAFELSTRVGLPKIIKKYMQPLVSCGVGSLASYWFLELTAFGM